jgi:hypothetical protein
VIDAAQIAGALERAKPQGPGKFVACCPAHDDREPSLSIADGDKGPVVHCHAGCSQAEVLDALAGLGVELRRPKVNGNGHDTALISGPLTLTSLAHAKGLSTKTLLANHVHDVEGGGVGFEYHNRAGQNVGMKIRRALAGDRGFRWRGEAGPGLYGLWRLEDMRALDGRLILCEGETDALTLWEHDFCALGLPGANNWHEDWIADLPDGPVYIVIEPDRGGQAVLAWLAKSKLQDRARLIRMTDVHKDPNALHLSDPAAFKDRFEALIQSAVHFKEPRQSRFRHAADIASNPVPISWLLRPYLEQMVLALLYGELGSMKSFVTLDMLLAISSGRSWGGAPYAVKKQPVAYVSAEGRGLYRRLRAWSMHHGVDLAATQFYALERAIDLSTPNKVIDLAEDIAALGVVPSIIGIDTLSKNKGPLDENDTAEMSTFLSLLDLHLRQRFGCSVLLVHHVGHAAKDRGRGSYTLMGDTDANYRIERPDPQELTIKISTGRLKDAESPAPLFLKAHIVNLGTKDEDGQDETSLVLLPTDEKPKEAKRVPTGKQQRALLTLLERQYETWEASTWDQATVRQLGRDRCGMGKSSAQAAVDALIDHGWLRLVVGGIVLGDPPERRPKP